MIVFISGPMTGLPRYNRREFDLADEWLSRNGHTVLNPANHTPLYNPEAIPHDGYLHICYAMIDLCGMVYFLRGWEKSKGSRLEMDYAVQTGKRIMIQEAQDDTKTR